MRYSKKREKLASYSLPGIVFFVSVSFINLIRAAAKGRYVVPKYSKQVAIPGKSAEDLYETVSDHIENFLNKVSMGKYQLERNPKKREISIQSPLFSANLICHDGSMELQGQISLMAMPLKSKIDAGIDKWLSKTFNLDQSNMSS